MSLQCLYCDYKTNYNHILSRHINKLHPDKKVIKEKICDKCGKIFTTYSACKKHISKNICKKEENEITKDKGCIVIEENEITKDKGCIVIEEKIDIPKNKKRNCISIFILSSIIIIGGIIYQSKKKK